MHMKIDRADWPLFADEFSENNQGRAISLERVSASVVSETIVEDAPLVAVDFDDEQPDTLMVTVRGEGDEVTMTHSIEVPESLWLYSDAEGKALSLEISTPDGTKTILRFERA